MESLGPSELDLESDEVVDVFLLPEYIGRGGTLDVEHESVSAQETGKSKGTLTRMGFH